MNVALQRVLPWHQCKSCTEPQKLVHVNCSDSQRGGMSQLGQLQLSGELAPALAAFEEYVLCLPETMIVNLCPKHKRKHKH